MKFTKAFLVKAPLDKVIECYTNDDIRKEWDSMIVSKAQVSGSPLQEGAQSIIHFKTPKGSDELQETILENKLPNSIKGLYVHKFMENTLHTHFEKINENETKVSLDVDYFKTKKFFITVFMKLFPKQFKSQVDNTMNEFKTYVEGLG